MTIFSRQLIGVGIAAIAIVIRPSPARSTIDESANEIVAGVSLNGKDAGKYREETREHSGEITDVVEQLYVFDRLGSTVEISSKEEYRQDRYGRLKGGHFEMSASKRSIVTDVAVQGSTLQVTTGSGDSHYSRTLPLSGELFGPHGGRLILQKMEVARTERYKAFVPAAGAIKEITLKCIARETLRGEGPSSAETLKIESSVEGIPGKVTMWVDRSGRIVRMLQDSPFGPIEIARANFKSTTTATAPVPGATYESSLSVSNVRLPHPRKLRSVTVELSKKKGAEPGWPVFSTDNQQVSSKTPDRIIITIAQPGSELATPGTAKSEPAFEKPNALVQSDDEQVRAIATKVAGAENNPWKKALALQKWVAANMHFDTGIAVAPASELARDRHGTCIGYATLLAALIRAEGIPSRIKLGYVYDSGIWGGHAWTEALIQGRWLPLDAAEYFPGVADAARIGVITVSGESGTIDNVGELALLYGKVAIRTLSYSLGQSEVSIPAEETGYAIQGNVYDNRHLGLRVTKSDSGTFKNVEAHWPDRTVVTIEEPDGSAAILYGRSNPDEPLAEQAAGLVKEIASSEWKDARWNESPGVRGEAGMRQAIVMQRDDVLWAIVASGENARALLERVLKSAVISAL